MLDGKYVTDYIESGDDMGEILELSLEDYKSQLPSSSTAKPTPRSMDLDDSVRMERKKLAAQISAIDEEISGYEKQINDLESTCALRIAKRDALKEQLQLLQSRGTKGTPLQNINNYNLDEFHWSKELITTMKKVFGIDQFRLCQRGVCNANIDARDIVCVMPTGGGKSLTYQLPALLTPGCTLVISPLISLITDQVFHLRAANVDAVMLTGGTPPAETHEILASLTALCSGGNASSSQTRDIKLCYVTPEKIHKSKQIMHVLEKLASGGKLARIVIDEAHCVSQLGHSFRPDYGKLSILRERFPRVPIIALSATCPPKVLRDLITNLKLKDVVDGSSAGPEGTVYFSAPLYRKNLHYSVLLKHSPAFTIRTIIDYIQKNHPDGSGIIYCLSKKDAESVASGLREGQIMTGVYHADVGDAKKEDLHQKWRQGAIKVVCATTAFGLGIDKGDVRFVLHHSIPKSLDGFYQESGRAGRDGKDSDCILYYRPQDVTRMCNVIYREPGARQKLLDMLRFAQDLHECRKVQFAKYFSASSDLSISSWTTEDSDALTGCGHCDNCTRKPGSVNRRDVTLEAWQVLKVSEAVHNSNGRLTISMLAEMVRGTGSGTVKGKGRESEKITVDLEAIAGGKINLSRDDTETLLVDLLVSDYLVESFYSNAYTLIVYVNPGPQADRLTQLSREQVANVKEPRVICSFRTKKKIWTKKTLPKVVVDKPIDKTKPVKVESTPTKHQPEETSEYTDDEREKGDDSNDTYGSDLGFFANMSRTPRKKQLKKRARSAESNGSSSDEGWSYSLRDRSKTSLRPRSSLPVNKKVKGEDPEVVIVSD